MKPSQKSKAYRVCVPTNWSGCRSSPQETETIKSNDHLVQSAARVCGLACLRPVGSLLDIIPILRITALKLRTEVKTRSVCSSRLYFLAPMWHPTKICTVQPHMGKDRQKKRRLQRKTIEEQRHRRFNLVRKAQLSLKHSASSKRLVRGHIGRMFPQVE